MMKLYNGDCLEVMKQIPDKSVDISFTSPPYNRKRNDKYANYDDTIQDYFGFLVDFTDELLRVTRKWCFVNLQQTIITARTCINTLASMRIRFRT